MKRILIPALLILSACAAEPLAEYRPMVDPAKTDKGKYETDLRECLSVAQQAKAKYDRQLNQQAWANLLVGALVGVAIGGAYGNDGVGIGEGAAIGAGAGALAGGGDAAELAHYGPRRLVDRCMAGRGHRVLNDIGRG